MTSFRGFVGEFGARKGRGEENLRGKLAGDKGKPVDGWMANDNAPELSRNDGVSFKGRKPTLAH